MNIFIEDLTNVNQDLKQVTHVTALGGKITVDSKVNEGTTFTISFKK